VRLFAEQIKGIGIAVTYAEVSKLSLEAETFAIKTNDGKKYLSKTVIIASGTQPRTFKDFAIPNLLRNRIYYEVYPLLTMRGKTIAIIGAGDAAFDYALNLARNNRVLILNRDSNVNCLPLLQQRADQNPHIHYQAGISISRVTEAPEGNLRLICNTSQQIMEIEADYLVGALGRKPQLDFLGEEISGKIQQLEKQGNLFLIGDVKNGLYRQTAIAVGDAIKVAMQIYQQEVST
jgi:thioredoxin reductase